MRRSSCWGRNRRSPATPPSAGTHRPASTLLVRKTSRPPGPQEAGRLGEPAGRVAPRGHPVLADHEVERARAERDDVAGGLDQREHRAEGSLAPAGGDQLLAAEVDPDHPGAATSGLRRQRGGAAPSSHTSSPSRAPSTPRLASGTWNRPHLISSLAQPTAMPRRRCARSTPRPTAHGCAATRRRGLRGRRGPVWSRRHHRSSRPRQGPGRADHPPPEGRAIVVPRRVRQSRQGQTVGQRALASW